MTFARGGGELTPFHSPVLEAALDLEARLVIVDTAADTFGGNENDRSQVRQFVSRALGSIAQKINGAVLLCAHPSRSGLSSGEGDGVREVGGRRHLFGPSPPIRAAGATALGQSPIGQLCSSHVREVAGREALRIPRGRFPKIGRA